MSIEDGFDDGPLTPDQVDSPQVLPSNNWGDNVMAGITKITDAATNRIATGIATPSGAMSNSTVRNFPPNSQGRNVQAFSTPGAPRQPFSWQTLRGNPVALVFAGIVIAAVIAYAVRRAK